MMKHKSETIETDPLAQLREERDALAARVKALSGLIEVGIIISAAVHLDEVLRLVMEKAQSVMQAEASSIFLINEEKNIFECPVALGTASDKLKTIEIPIGVGIAGWVASHGEAQLIPDAYKDRRFNPEVDLKTGFVTRSILAAPLKVRDKLIGVAEVINRTDGRAFSEDDLELFSAFCRQVAMAIQTARIHELELEKQRIEQQLEAAKFIQQSFMPEALPTSANRKFEVAATSIAATAVGGDLFDFVEIDAQTLGVSVGDVSGKGIPAALFMARLVSDFRLHSQRISDPEQLVAVLNKALVERTRRGMFVTFLYGILDAASGDFSFANAGHLPPVYVHGDTGAVELLPAESGIPLGIAPDMPFPTTRVRLKLGDFLVLVTDGVVEAKNKTGEGYGFERLKAVLENPGTTAQEVLDKLLRDVENFSSGLPPHDDLTAVVLKLC